MNVELCWNITAQCNQGCKYCHRFLGIQNLSKKENVKVLKNIIDCGCDNITYTGGEALLIDYLEELLGISHSHNIINKLITNGVLLTEERFSKIKNIIDKINLSIDSLNNDTNIILGRGIKHIEVIKNRIEMIEKSNVELSINSVMTKLNIADLYGLGEYLSNKKIEQWRIFKFMPLREKARENEENFAISREIFDENIKKLRGMFPKLNIVTRDVGDFEKLYVLILANGDIYQTIDGTDVKIGNALKDKIFLIGG